MTQVAAADLGASERSEVQGEIEKLVEANKGEDNEEVGSVSRVRTQVYCWRLNVPWRLCQEFEHVVPAA